MGYGGPRVEFYTANQYSNYAAAIDKENAARVGSIIQRHGYPQVQEEQRKREEAFRAYEKDQADQEAQVRADEEAALERRRIKDERARHRIARQESGRIMTAAERATQCTRYAHICRLAKPRIQSAPQYGKRMLKGSVPQQSLREGNLPTQGRGGAVYSAGVDRDRIVPARPYLNGTTPPWVGSYSTHHGQQLKQRLEARDEAEYYCAEPLPLRSSADMAERQQTLSSIAAEHAVDQPLAKEFEAAAIPGEGTPEMADWTLHRAEHDRDNEADVESIFSHGSSNKPIAATGNMHLTTSSTKGSVLTHLTRYGGAMTAPRPPRTGRPANPEQLTLPELVNRLVKTQLPASKVR